MREKQFTRPLTIVLQEGLYEQVKKETDKGKISFSQWFRDAALQKLKYEKEVSQDVEEKEK